MWNFDLIHNFDFLFWNGLKKILLLYGELFSLLNSKPRLLHNRTFTTLHYYYQLDYYIFRELLYLHFFLLTDNHSIQPVIIWLFAIFHCNKTSRPSGEERWAGHQAIPLSAIRENTISRFHPIAQKQRNDLNIPLGLVSRRSRGD